MSYIKSEVAPIKALMTVLVPEKISEAFLGKHICEKKNQMLYILIWATRYFMGDNVYGNNSNYFYSSYAGFWRRKPLRKLQSLNMVGENVDER